MPEHWSLWVSLGSTKKYVKWYCPKFSEEYQDAMVMDGEEVLTLRAEES